MSKSNLGILVLDNFKDFGHKVQEHLEKTMKLVGKLSLNNIKLIYPLRIIIIKDGNFAKLREIIFYKYDSLIHLLGPHALRRSVYRNPLFDKLSYQYFIK